MKKGGIAIANGDVKNKLPIKLVKESRYVIFDTLNFNNRNIREEVHCEPFFRQSDKGTPPADKTP